MPGEENSTSGLATAAQEAETPKATLDVGADDIERLLTDNEGDQRHATPDNAKDHVTGTADRKAGDVVEQHKLLASSSADATSVEEEEKGVIALEEDVYSLLFVSGCSGAMIYSISVVAFQLVIVGLLSWDIVRNLGGNDDGTNILNVPINVERQVRIAQFMAIPLAVMVHRDCTTAVYLLQAKYEDERIKPHSPHASSTTWYLSLFLRFVVGFCLVGVSFVLILQSDRIINLFLNLAALAFVGEIDDFGFYLASKGFLKKELGESCEQTENISLRPWRGVGRTITRRVLILITWIGLTAGFIVTVVHQDKGTYLQSSACKSFSVRFGSQEFPVRTADISFEDTLRFYAEANLEGNIKVPYSSFTGTYTAGSVSRGTFIADERAVYYESVSVDINDQSDRSVGIFRFCSDGARGGNWIFKVRMLADATHPKPDENDCTNWLLRSPSTTSFLLEDVSGTWQAWTGEIADAQDLSIVCDDCQDDFGCNLQGTCKRGVCECNDGALGNTCSFPEPCGEFSASAVGRDSTEFVDVGTFHLMRTDTFNETKEATPCPQLAYGRPIYFLNSANESMTDLSSHLSDYEDDTNLNECDGSDLTLIFYSGDRWLYGTFCPLAAFDLFFISTISAHAFWDQNYDVNIDALTEPTLSGTPQGIQWNERLISQSVANFGFFGATQPYALSFQCASDDCSDQCGRLGDCNPTTNLCECSFCFGGVFCEYSPTGRYAGDEFESALAFQSGSNPDYEPSEYYSRFWSDIDLSSCSQ